MSKERASLGFGDELNAFDPDEFRKPDRRANHRPEPEDAKRAAEAAGFRSREPVKDTPTILKPAGQQRRRRTGRNVQFNIKTTADTIAAFTRIADARGWGIGETFEYATALLEKDQESRPA
jgi:hypothetical protein